MHSTLPLESLARARDEDFFLEIKRRGLNKALALHANQGRWFARMGSDAVGVGRMHERLDPESDQDDPVVPCNGYRDRASMSTGRDDTGRFCGLSSSGGGGRKSKIAFARY